LPHRSWKRALAGIAALGLLATGASAAESAGVRVSVSSPGPGGKLRDVLHQARIEGSALAENGGPDRFDVMLVIDVSDSTKVASGADVDGDGQVGVNPHNELLPPGAFPADVFSTDPGDTVLQAEILAARSLLQGLDPRRARVGLATFSGEVNPSTGERKSIDQQDAWLEVPLTDDYTAVDRALNGVLARGPNGATNYAAGIRLGILELAGLSGARSTPRPGASKVILFLTDGMPTLPVGKGNSEDPGDDEAALRAAQLARSAGILINTYALGPQALKYPRVVTEMARMTVGTYTPVQNPGDIVTLLQGVTFADVEDVVLTNLSTGEFSTDVQLAPDGSFKGYVPVREGRNRVRVSALASDGSRGSTEFEFDFQYDQVGDRSRLGELERIREQNKQLELHRLGLEVDKFRREQKRQLEIEAQRPQGSSAKP
jgi:von Willebrand factor type A domain